MEAVCANQKAGHSLQALIDAGMDGELRSVRATIARHGRTEAAVDELFEKLTSFGSGVIDRITALSKPACRAGCFHCCHIPVSVSAVEAIALAHYLTRVCDEESLMVLRKRIAEHVEWSASLAWDRHAKSRRLCALLGEDGRCSVHPSRPMSCRWTTSFSAKQCEDAVTGASEGYIDADLQALMWGRAAALGLKAGLKEAGLDDNCYELHSALLRALSTPSIKERWIRGEDVFAGCKVTPE